MKKPIKEKVIISETAVKKPLNESINKSIMNDRDEKLYLK